MVWVLDECDAEVAGQRLVLLALANFSYDGTPPFRAFPSVASIARAARMSERNAQYSLRALEEKGYIVRLGASEYGTYIYEFGGAKIAPPQEVAPEPRHTNERITHPHGSGATSGVSVSQIAPLDLSGEQQEVLRVLRAVADMKGLDSPRVDLILKAMQAYPNVDHLVEAESLEAWAVNPKKVFANINSTYRAWLRRSSEKPRSTMKDEQMGAVKAVREMFDW